MCWGRPSLSAEEDDAQSKLSVVVHILVEGFSEQDGLKRKYKWDETNFFVLLCPCVQVLKSRLQT